MKSTLATIIGTAALGLIKSKMGSGVKLKYACLSIHQGAIAIPKSTKEAVLEFIKDFEPMLNLNDVFIEMLQEGLVDDDPEEPAIIVLTTKKIVKSDHELERCKLLMSDEADQLGSYYEYWAEGETSKELEHFFYRVIFPAVQQKFGFSDEMIDYAGTYDLFDEEYVKVIIDVETGKEYEPPKPMKSNLRKR